jgi:glutamate racemase
VHGKPREMAETTQISNQGAEAAIPTVLIFDSGAGGLSVAASIAETGLKIRLVYLADDGFFPYGDKADGDLLHRIPELVIAGIEATNAALVVVACNTASTLALDAIRARTKIPIVGVVPAIKPAAAITKTGVVGLLGTPATVRRRYTDQLIADHAASLTVIRHGAPDLAKAAELEIIGTPANPAIYKNAIDAMLTAPGGEAMDVVVLACTHFPLVRTQLAAAAPRRFEWIDSGAAIARRVAHLLGLTPTEGTTAFGPAWTTGTPDDTRARAFAKFGFSPLLAFEMPPVDASLPNSEVLANPV